MKLLRLPSTPASNKSFSRDFAPSFADFIIGGLAGCCAKTAIAPLDRAKINFQTSEMYFNVKALIKFLRHSYVTAGVRSLWRGNSATLTRIFPYAAVQYGVHERAKHYLGINDLTHHCLSKSQVQIRLFLAGCIAGSASVSFTYPLDLVRARMAVTERVKYANLVDVVQLTYREGGLRTLYHGFTPALLGILPYSGIAFYTFETLKEWRLKKRITSDGRSPRSLRPLENLSCGAFAGVLGQTASYPLDIVRRRMQTAGVTGHPEYTRSILGTMQIVYQQEGLFHGLYKGVTMNWIKGPIAAGISFTVFHQLQHFYALL
ncbi:solute carrier family 25 2 [Echinococcus multilocularis]|uniref:Solute carrier family 25 2 n=1 Tax=Echinococcus multilocularis TaxID=6211 RepID=A0A068XXS9_ECHMU|nr:solute carrier family 25 2 [Echinococcus multilocularis]